MHGGHGHAHHHHGHEHSAHLASNKRYSVAIALNLGFVAIEAAGGFFANSTALLADAAHNLSDVLGLALAGGAAWLVGRASSARRTYGYGKAEVLAALANGLVLVGASGAILWESLTRFAAPQAAQGGLIMLIAAAGVIINGATALLFAVNRRHDINVRGAFVHMAADAGVSAGVIVAGAAIWLTGARWIDPAISVLVVALVLWSAWGLLREALDLAMDTAPAHIDVAAVREALAAQPGVAAVHDLHVWPIGAAHTALTAHLERPEGGDDAFLESAATTIGARFGIKHITLQVERKRRGDCAECP
jgi:cobalt-zinc-cadmium efflux system protein